MKSKHHVPERVKPSFVMFDIRAERQSARMSNITNDGLTRYGTCGNSGVKGLCWKVHEWNLRHERSAVWLKSASKRRLRLN